MKKKLLLVSLIGGAFLLSGCNEKEMPPKCDSKETKALLSKIFAGHLAKEGLSHIKISFTGHEMIEEHPKAKEYTCQARAIYNESGEVQTALINYSVFLNDNDKGQFVVVINDNSE